MAKFGEVYRSRTWIKCPPDYQDKDRGHVTMDTYHGLLILVDVETTVFHASTVFVSGEPVPRTEETTYTPVIADSLPVWEDTES